MTDKFGIDGHKLGYHIDRVSGWLAGEMIYPIYVEISPSRACNHRCLFCGFDFMGYEAKTLETDILTERLTEMGSLGVKSVMYGGEGEPFMHKDMAGIITHTKQKAGIDVAVTTNGVLLKPATAERILSCVEWIKVSINAGTAATYALIHRTKEEDFRKVIANIEQALKIREANGYKCTIGMQMLLLPENRDEAELLARTARDIGADYLVIKPYSQPPQSTTERYKNISYAEYMGLAETLTRFNGGGFSVIFRINAMRKHDEGRKSYPKCLALPFMSYIDADGGVWGCNDFLGDKRFYYGNILESSFKGIWEGEPRRKSMEWVERQMSLNACRVNCRLDEINKYLWSVRTPPRHVNFI